LSLEFIDDDDSDFEPVVKVAKKQPKTKKSSKKSSKKTAKKSSSKEEESTTTVSTPLVIKKETIMNRALVAIGAHTRYPLTASRDPQKIVFKEASTKLPFRLKLSGVDPLLSLLEVNDHGIKKNSLTKPYKNLKQHAKLLTSRHI
jgi:hypothetical protein